MSDYFFVFLTGKREAATPIEGQGTQTLPRSMPITQASDRGRSPDFGKSYRGG